MTEQSQHFYTSKNFTQILQHIRINFPYSFEISQMFSNTEI